MADDSIVYGELKRYLARRRRFGLDVIHRLGDDVRDVREEAGGALNATHRAAAGAPHGAAAEAGAPEADSRPASRATPRIETDERKGSNVKDAEAKPTAAKGSERPGAPSIRYRYEAHPSSQANLFGGNAARSGPDVGRCDLASLEKLVSECTSCPLSTTRTKTVFGSGAADARIIFIGEAPGREEDIQGLPFVGRAGKLLTKILASVGWNRDEVYIANILKCRPPDNRDPVEEEITACGIYFQRQIELLDPVLICALGRVAGQNLLRTNAPLSALRQNVHYYNDTKVIVTYHPAALLRNPNLKRAAWEDIQKVRGIYDEAMGRG
jgi:DNA polymerase